MKKIMFNELAKEIYIGNKKRGFDSNVDVQPLSQSMMLIVTEISEAVEADRKNRKCLSNISKIANEEIFDTEAFKNDVKDTIEDELADVVIRTLDFCGANGIDIDSHIRAKLRYNETRQFKHGKKY